MEALKTQDVELKQKAGRLRRQLADLEKEAIEAGLLHAFNKNAPSPLNP